MEASSPATADSRFALNFNLLKKQTHTCSRPEPHARVLGQFEETDPVPTRAGSITPIVCCATLETPIPVQRGPMAHVSRIGVSLESDLLDRFDKFIAEKGYDNRSEAFRDLIRDRLVGTAVVASKALVVGTVTLIYDHHTRLLPEKLADLQHEHHHVVISTLHAHLDLHTCLEVVLLRGKSRDVQQLADKLISTKGVRHGRLVMSSPDTVSPRRHSHH